MTSPTPRQREILDFIGRGGAFVRRAGGQPWQLVDAGEPVASWISDAGLAAMHGAGWIDGGAGVGNMVEFAPQLTELDRDELGEPRTASAPAAPATTEAIDADVIRRRSIGLSNARIVEATGMTSCRVLHVLDDRIPDAPAPGVPLRTIDPAAVDAEPPRPDPGPVSANCRTDDPWMADEVETLRKGVADAIQRSGPYRPHKVMLIPYRRIGHAFGRTEGAVRSKALSMLRASASLSKTPETRS